MSAQENRAQGWHADDVGGTKFWDGQKWTGDVRPPRKPFAAASANRGWGIGLTIAGALFLLSSPGQFTQSSTSSMSPIGGFFFAVLLGAGLLAGGIYLLRGQGPSTKSVLARLQQERLAAAVRSTPPPPPAQPTSAPQTININVGNQSGDAAAAAQVQAISNPETAKALQNLQNLLYTRTITDDEFQAAKDKLLGKNS